MADLGVPVTGAQSASTCVTLHLLNGPSYTITPPEDFPGTAMYWEFVLRNRIRWAQDTEASDSVSARALQALAALGIDSGQLAEMAKAGVVEIDIPYTSAHEEIGWELRVFPWEFLLVTGTANERTGPLIVIRHVCCDERRDAVWRKPQKLMVVESAPGKFAEMYSFDSERKLVESNLMLNKVYCPRNPTVARLKELVADGQPDIVHLAGIDSHQGEQLLHQLPRTVWDGYLVSDDEGNPTYATAEQLADALRGKKGHAPVLVSCNFWNSAPRVAALIAAEAESAAIGFQDEVDDQVAEDFFARFYFNYRAMDWDLLRAYRLAVHDMRFGGAIPVLWSSRSLLPGAEEKPLQQDADRLRARRQEFSQHEIPADADPRDLLDVVVRLKARVNYSLLHNDESLFEEFSIRKLRDGVVRGIALELTLFVGEGHSFPYRRLFDMEESYLALGSRIRFPLTSTLLRSIRESVKSVIFIEVSWNGRALYRDTLPVNLLAIDEWVDTPELDAYLPSFVLPRDRAVARVVDSAQRYLRLLTEDSGAGFDGYQSVDPKADDPYETVDLQIRAIWSALTYDSSLSYINPPPCFTESSQRLRTPSDVIDGKRGTCIDLALLLAACLEYVGIYPVIFLVEGHAFPGYWRSAEARQAFIRMSGKSTIPESEASGRLNTSAWTPTKPWVFTSHAEIQELVKNESIVPIETVWLTRQYGFSAAIEEATNRVNRRLEFNCMIDIRGARTDRNPVTPLPIVDATS